VGSGFAGDVLAEVVEAALMPVRPGDALEEALDSNAEPERRLGQPVPVQVLEGLGPEN